MLTVLTPTGERPDAFALCQKQLARQTYAGLVRWVVIDDGEVPSSITLGRDNWTVEVIRPEPFWKPKQNTQGRNLKAGLELVGPDDVLTVWEDDDWYHPDWLQTIADKIGEAELIGEGQAVYYNVRSRRYNKLRNHAHSSLRCSAMRGAAIDTFRTVLSRFSVYYDFDLWKAHANKLVFSGSQTVGMKGLPGRPGIATGHDPKMGSADPDMEQLREWIGDDVEFYRGFYEESLMAQKTKQMRAMQDFKYGERGLIKAGQVFHLRSDKEESLFISCGRAMPFNPDKDALRHTPRKMKVETQTQKLAEVVVEKAPEPVEEPKEEEKNEEEKPRKRHKFSSGF